MEQDQRDRWAYSLRLFRGCRLFDYVFIANTTTEAIEDDGEGEIKSLRILRSCKEEGTLCNKIKGELRTDKSLAQSKSAKAQKDRLGRWAFLHQECLE